MDAIILDQDNYDKLIIRQSGQNQLAPMPLIDSTYFLTVDALYDPMYEGQFDDINYTIVPWSYVEPLLPPTPPEE
jgi:hypothetical protein